jgi:glycosyltransferase involved in cell wall biosynthesis
MTLYQLIIWKRMLEDLVMRPFIWWGRYLARRHPLEGNFDIFFFFPFYHIGGAEKVHTQIAAALRNRKAVIYFTRKSHTAFFLEDFRKAGHHIIDISFFTDNKWKYWNNLVYRGMISAYINRQPGKKVVFNGQSNFGYKLSRWIAPEIPQIELIHSLSSFSYIRIPFLPFYRETVMISRNRISDHLELYKKFGIPEYFNHRIRFIINGIPLPGSPVPKIFTGEKMKLLYAGRDTPEKRVHLVRKIGEACINAKVPVMVMYMGEVSGVLTAPHHSYELFYGNVGDPIQIDVIYHKADVLMITSSEEGFPMVVMEAMARGCIILATPVGDLPVHIRPGINGFLFSQVNIENQIIDEAAGLVSKLQSDPALCSAISANNINYAAEHFGLATFEKNYQELFDNYLS